MIALLALWLAAAPAAPAWSHVSLLGWTDDSRSIAWHGSLYTLEKPDGLSPCELVFLVVADAKGRTQKLYRVRRWVPMDEVTWEDADAEAAWDSAEAEGSGERWLREHRLSGAQPERKIRGTFTQKQGNDPLVARVALAGRGCRTARLGIGASKSTPPLLEDRCPAGADEYGGFESRLQLAWAPDGSGVAVAWNTIRSGPEANDRSRGHFAVTRRGAGEAR